MTNQPPIAITARASYGSGSSVWLHAQGNSFEVASGRAYSARQRLGPAAPRHFVRTVWYALRLNPRRARGARSRVHSPKHV